METAFSYMNTGLLLLSTLMTDALLGNYVSFNLNSFTYRFEFLKSTMFESQIKSKASASVKDMFSLWIKYAK